MVRLSIYLFTLFFVNSAFSFEPEVKRAFADAVKTLKSSANFSEVQKKLKLFYGDDEKLFQSHFGNQKVPPFEVDLEKLKIVLKGAKGKKFEFLISEIDRDGAKVKVNGIDYKYNPQAPLAYNILILEKALAKSMKTSLHVFKFLESAWAEEVGRPANYWDTLRQVDPTDAIFTLKNVGPYMLPIAPITGGLAAGSGVLFLLFESPVNAAINAQTPSCDDQVKALKAVLRSENLALKRLDCGKYLLGFVPPKNERLIEFYRGGAEPASFHANWWKGRLTSLEPRGQTGDEFDEKGPVYFFDDQLVRVGLDHEIQNSYTGDAKKARVYYDNGSKFETYREDIEPIRKVLYYLGTNNSCNKCGAAFNKLREDRSLVRSTAGPTSGSMPAN